MCNLDSIYSLLEELGLQAREKIEKTYGSVRGKSTECSDYLCDLLDKKWGLNSNNFGTTILRYVKISVGGSEILVRHVLVLVKYKGHRIYVDATYSQFEEMLGRKFPKVYVGQDPTSSIKVPIANVANDDMIQSMMEVAVTRV